MNQTNAQSEPKAKPGVVLKLALLQMLGTACFCLVLYSCCDVHSALSGFFGGLIAALANVFFAGRLFVTKEGLEATQILRRFYRSVSLKVLFTLSMFAICIIVIKVSMLPFIIMYFVAAVIINWLFLLIDARD